MSTRHMRGSTWRPDDTSALSGGAESSRRYQSVASYPRYPDAERAVDRLSDNGFPVQNVAIVGRGLRSVEQVTGRRTYWTAAGQYALAGAIGGALIGWFLGLFDLVDPLVAAFWLAASGALIGAFIGTALGLLVHAMTDGRRDFSSVGTVQADRYDLQVDTRYADQAARVLAADRGR
ncbi:general stress protein [Micromonospora sp. CPCC 206061]|uniref:general stress protein n=1 Tax=Micromonospora sp. CPCC 206061 TaxID=3122410 RepID=UPI002FF085BC